MNAKNTKKAFIIPSYWSRESKIGWKEGDAIYDHPTPLDEEGTLKRALESLMIINKKDFILVIIAVPTSEEIEDEVEEKVSFIVKTATHDLKVKTFIFGPGKLKKIKKLLKKKGLDRFSHLLKIEGYSNVRNLCIFLPHLLGCEMAVLIDDDQVFDDPEFSSKTEDFISKKIDDKMINGIAGFYTKSNGDYRIDQDFCGWMGAWDKIEKMNEGFDKIIGTPPRIKPTPFVFGGNMILHRNLFTQIPFDPNVKRGEDIDYLINARMFGYSFYLDNELSIIHLPPKKSHPQWMRLREDIYRFIYERSKLKTQTPVTGMIRVFPEDLDPYPGAFLKDDLEHKIEKASRMMAEEYKMKLDNVGAKEALKNIEISLGNALPEFDPFKNLIELQKDWGEMMALTGKGKINRSLRKILEQ